MYKVIISSNKQEIKMQLSQLKDVVSEHHRQAGQDNAPQPKVEIEAIYCKSVEGYVVLARVNSLIITISSQRTKRRVFKTLEALRRALHEVDLRTFTVKG